MTDMVADLVVVVGTVVVLAGLAWLPVRLRRNGTVGPAIGAAMVACDEVVHVTAYETFIDLRAQDCRLVSLSSPRDR